LHKPACPSAIESSISSRWTDLCSRRSILAAIVLLLPLAQPVAAGSDAEASGINDENVFFDQLPVVLSVSRLAQPLRDAPGSVTVIEAEEIRASGARNLADLLRAVPGFLVAQSSAGAPVAGYHVVTDENPRGLQILVDGRSQYSPLFYGGVSWNLVDVSLDDIERVEVVRGSNSAAYGSNAFLGVVNVITRAAAVTPGIGARIAQGSGGLADRYARLGMRLGNAHLRLSAERSRDNGVMDFNDSRRNERANLRADLPLGLSDELHFQSGFVDLWLNAGQPGDTREPPRVIDAKKDFASAAWVHTAENGGETALRYSRSRERYNDVFAAHDSSLDGLAASLGLPSPYLVWIDQRIETLRDELEFQHTLVPAETTRLVWGAGARYDKVRGKQFYGTDDALQQKVHRLFGNFEWRPESWGINLGATWENDSLSDSSLAPRFSANYHLTPQQTLRTGWTRSHRIPTLTESRARTAYGSFDTASLGLAAGVVPVEITRKASGNLTHERIDVKEIGYLGDFRAQRLFLDVRAFNEHVRDRIVPVALPLTPPDCDLLGLLTGGCGKATDFINGQDIEIRGVEYQARWRPRDATELTLGQTYIAIESQASPRFYARDRDAAEAAVRHIKRSAPEVATVLRWQERLPLGLEASIAHYHSTPFQWTVNSSVAPLQRTDVGLSYRLRIDGTDGELALVVQGVGGGALHKERAVGPGAAEHELRSRAWLTLTLGV
jgi:iron complex outermembrane recepter protein